MKETATFKWTREDGKYVIIENNVMKAFDVDGNELQYDSDEANDLFVEMHMVTDETMMLSKPEGIDLGDFHYQMHCAYKHIGHHCCVGGPVPMGLFGNPMFRPGFMHRHNHSQEEMTEEEIAYQHRKHMMKYMQEERDEEREREARRKQKIIDTSIPYEVESEICPDNLITENNEYYLEKYGTTMVSVGHDTENYNLYNIIKKDKKYLLKKHQRRIERVIEDKFLMYDEQYVQTYYDAKQDQVLFSTKPGIRDTKVVSEGLSYRDDKNTYCYNYDGKLMGVVSNEWTLDMFIGGRAVVEKRIEENGSYEYRSNIIMPDGTFMFSEPVREVRNFGHHDRFEVQREDRISEIYSILDFKKIYESDKPRRVDSHCYESNREDKDLFIFNSRKDKNMGIVVNVMTGEVITKDKDGNIKEFKNIEYPNWSNNYNWRAELSVTTHRMERVDPMTWKRLRKKANKQ